MRNERVSGGDVPNIVSLTRNSVSTIRIVTGVSAVVLCGKAAGYIGILHRGKADL